MEYRAADELVTRLVEAGVKRIYGLVGVSLNPDYSHLQPGRCSDIDRSNEDRGCGFSRRAVQYEILLSGICESLGRSCMVLDREMEISGLRHCYGSLSRRERQVMRAGSLRLVEQTGRPRTGYQRNHPKGTP